MPRFLNPGPWFQRGNVNMFTYCGHDFFKEGTHIKNTALNFECLDSAMLWYFAWWCCGHATRDQRVILQRAHFI